MLYECEEVEVLLLCDDDGDALGIRGRGGARHDAGLYGFILCVCVCVRPVARSRACVRSAVNENTSQQIPTHTHTQRPHTHCLLQFATCLRLVLLSIDCPPLFCQHVISMH